MARQGGDHPESAAKRRLELIAAIVGACLALATLGVILWEGVRGDGRPPFVAVRAEGVQAFEDGFVVLVDAVNSGDWTAAEVVVEGELRRGEEVVATSETTFDYIPSRSHRRGGLFFSEDPRSLDITLRAKGYRNP